MSGEGATLSYLKSIDERGQRMEEKLDDFMVRHEAQDDAIHKGLIDQIVQIQLERSEEKGARKIRMRYIGVIGTLFTTGAGLLGAWWENVRH